MSKLKTIFSSISLSILTLKFEAAQSCVRSNIDNEKDEKKSFERDFLAFPQHKFYPYYVTENFKH